MKIHEAEEHRPPATPERRGLEPNGLKYEPSGGKPTISCRSGVFVEAVVFSAQNRRPPNTHPRQDFQGHYETLIDENRKKEKQ